MKENTDIQLIENYIDGLLKGKELTDFQNRLEKDVDFAKAYHLRIKLANMWQQADEYQQTRAQIREVIDEEKKSRFFNHRKGYYLLAIAASIILLLGAYWLFDSREMNVNNQIAETADTIVFQVDKPDKLAEIKYVTLLISPENKQFFHIGDTIVFRWETAVEDREIHLVIKNSNNDETVFQINDYTKDNFHFSTKNLTAGKYLWSVGDTANKRFFTIK